MTATTDRPKQEITLPVSGMTCAACQARVQRALTKAPGVADATVNLLMNSATVSFDPAATTPEAIVDTIRGTGYGASLPAPTEDAFKEQEARDAEHAAEYRELKWKAIVSGIVGIVAMVLSMPLMADPMAAHTAIAEPLHALDLDNA